MVSRLHKRDKESYQYLDPRPRFRVSYWWQKDIAGNMCCESMTVQTQETGHIHIYIPEEHARFLRGQVTIVRLAPETERTGGSPYPRVK